MCEREHENASDRYTVARNYHRTVGSKGVVGMFASCVSSGGAPTPLAQ